MESDDDNSPLSSARRAPLKHFSIDCHRMSGVRHERWRAGDGPLTERRMMKLMEFEGCDVLVFTYRAGTVFPEHEHAQSKVDGVLEGVLRVRVGDDVFDLKPGDRLYIPAGTRHAAEVVGEKTVVSLDGTFW